MDMNMDQISGIFVGGILAMTAIGTLVSFVMTVLSIVGRWKTFRKMGEPGWKCLIPLYSTWVEYSHTWNPVMMIPVCLLCGVGSLMSQRAAEGSVLYYLALAVSLAGGVLNIMGMHKLSKAFGHGGGFTAGLFLFPGIFSIILGFGSSRFIGRDGVGDDPVLPDGRDG